MIFDKWAFVFLFAIVLGFQGVDHLNAQKGPEEPNSLHFDSPTRSNAEAIIFYRNQSSLLMPTTSLPKDLMKSKEIYQRFLIDNRIESYFLKKMDHISSCFRLERSDSFNSLFFQGITAPLRERIDSMVSNQIRPDFISAAFVLAEINISKFYSVKPRGLIVEHEKGENDLYRSINVQFVIDLYVNDDVFHNPNAKPKRRIFTGNHLVESWVEEHSVMIRPEDRTLFSADDISYYDLRIISFTDGRAHFNSIEGSFPEKDDFFETTSYRFLIERNESLTSERSARRIREVLNDKLHLQVQLTSESVYSEKMSFVTSYSCPRSQIPGSECFRETVPNVGEDNTFIAHWISFLPTENSDGKKVFEVEIKSIGKFRRLMESKIRNIRNTALTPRCMKYYYPFVESKLKTI